MAHVIAKQAGYEVLEINARFVAGHKIIVNLLTHLLPLLHTLSLNAASYSRNYGGIPDLT